MKLLYIHERIGALGGAEVNILLTARAMLRMGHSICLAYGSHGEPGSDHPEWREVFPQRIALGDSDSIGASEVGGALEKFQPDVIVLNKFANARVLEALATSGFPVVRIVHDHDLYCMRSYKYHYFSRKICTRAASPYCIFPCGASIGRSSGTGFPLRWISYSAKRREIEINKRFNRMVVATEYMKEELLRNGFAEDRIEIHAPVPRSTQSLDDPSFGARNLIVFSGQIIRGKGVDVLLEALARVRSKFECVIIGDGRQRPDCERLSRSLGLEDRVRFTGFIPQDQIAGNFRDASVAVMSSVWPEPFGAAGLEAMRCGLPVVAFDAGGIREWLLNGENGFLVPWMDRDAFAARIDELLADKGLARRLGHNGRRLADERFNFDAYIGGLENLFARTAKRTAAEAENKEVSVS